MVKKRLFIALPVTGDIAEAINGFKYTHNLPVRWTQESDLHITLVPPWYDTNEKLKTKSEKLRTIKSEKFEIHLKEIVFAPPKRPRLIWATGETPQGLISLKNKLELVPGFKPEGRPFKIHITLARFREKQFATFPKKALHEKISWQFTADRFVLMESHLGREGAHYTTLEQFMLHE